MSKRRQLMIAGLVGMFLLLGAALPGQNFESRFSQIERRLDQVQNRVDSVEREQRMQGVTPVSRPEVSREMILELQRQQNSLAEQAVSLERRMLELKKAVDRIEEREAKQEEGKPKGAESPKRRP